MLRSFAQNFEDVVLWRALGAVAAGCYVDVGAADPEADSVTKLFYDRGWSGLNVEPVGDFAERLRAARPRDATVQACAGEQSGEVTLHQVSGTGLSSVVDQAGASAIEHGHIVDDVVVPQRRLDQMLTDEGFEGRPIHFLKVDVEGVEDQVLAGIDLDVWRPWVIVVESTSPRSVVQTHDCWEPQLVKHAYEFCLFDGLNRFYVASERAELKSVLSYPACVFDQPFVSPAHAELLDEYDQLLASTETIQSTYRETLVSFERLETEYNEAIASYGRLETEYNEAIASYGRLEILHKSVSGEAVSLRAAVADLGAQCSTLRAGVVSMADELDEARASAARRVSVLEAQVASYSTSTSWRITAPLRTAMDTFKSLAARRTALESGG